MRVGPQLACALGAATLLGGAAPAAQGSAAPFGELVSITKAFDYVLREVCVPATLGQGSIETLALRNYLKPVSPRAAGAPSAARAWRLASISKIHVVDWADGSCSASSEDGSASELEAVALQRLKALNLPVVAGVSEPAREGKAARTAYCTPDPRPFVAAVTVKTARSKNPAILITTFRARAERPGFCAPALSPGPS